MLDHWCKALGYTTHPFCNWIRICIEIGQGPYPLQWRHNGRDRVSNHQPHDCLLNHLFRRRSKKTSKLHVTGLCAGSHRDRWIPRTNGQLRGKCLHLMNCTYVHVYIWFIYKSKVFTCLCSQNRPGYFFCLQKMIVFKKISLENRWISELRRKSEKAIRNWNVNQASIFIFFLRCHFIKQHKQLTKHGGGT